MPLIPGRRTPRPREASLAERSGGDERSARSGRSAASVWRIRSLLVLFGVFLALLPELALRLAGFGGRPPFLVPLVRNAGEDSAAAGLFEVNPRLGEIFFARPTEEGQRLVGGHRRELLRVPKPPRTLRVVFAGASSVEGFPLPRNLTAARFLEAMLRRLLPDRPVEVVNLGMTAVASFPVRKLAEDALAGAEPDLLLVYAGHNEFFGASGIASLQSMGRSVRAMELFYLVRRSALLQAARAVVAPPPGSLAEGRRHLLEVMAATDSVEPEGELHAAARRSLRGNLARLARRARRLGVPVVIGTLVSNERDLAPLGSWEGDLIPEEREAWSERLAAASELAELRSLAARAPRHAGAAYAVARSAGAAGETEAAAEAYRRARDLDALPWRAGRDKNAVLREVAAAEGAALADCEREFAAAAGGVTGWALFYDHVHPSLEGQALLARCFLESAVRGGLLPVEPERLAALPDWRRLAGELGANPLERYLVLHKMATLFAVPPAAATNAAAAARFRRAVAGLERTMGPVERAALARWREASREAGFALAISYFGAAAALRAGDLRRAALYLPGAVGNAFPFADDRCAAYLLRQIACALGGAADCRPGLGAALREAEAVASMPGQPTALLARARAGLHLLAGEAEAARAWEAVAAERAPEAAPWMRATLRELPTLDQLAALLSPTD